MASHGSHAPPSSTTTTQPGDETIHTTANHPWLSADRGWVVAGHLQLGEPVRRVDGSVAVVVALTPVHGTAPIWDLTVSHIHDFAVGSGAYVVHNCGNVNRSRVGQKIVSDADSAHLEDIHPDPRSPTYRGMQVSHESLRSEGYTLRPENVDRFEVTRPGKGWKRVSYLAHKLYGGFKEGDWSYIYEHWKKPGAPDIENHYWLHKLSGDMFHHH